MKRTDRTNLQLVTMPPEHTTGGGHPTQVSMFPSSGAPVICIVHMPTVSGERFEHTIRALRPAQVFDFRAVPTFNIGRLNRTGAFHLFEAIGTYYYDVPALVGASTRVEAKLKRLAMSDALVAAVRSHKGKQPIMVLLDDARDVGAAAATLPRALSKDCSATEWNIHVER